MVFKNSRERLADRHPEGAVPAPAGHSCPRASDSVYTQSLSHRNDVTCSKLESGTRAGNASRPRGKRSFLRPKPHVLTDVLPDRSGSVLRRVPAAAGCTNSTRPGDDDPHGG